MFKQLQAPAVAIAGVMLLAGCAENSALFGGASSVTTASIVEPPKSDPACIALASQIDGLKKEGIADKVAQASIKKYKMTTADLAKADQLNKTNTDYQARCSIVKPPSAVQAAATPAAPAAAGAALASPSAATAAGKRTGSLGVAATASVDP